MEFKLYEELGLVLEARSDGVVVMGLDADSGRGEDGGKTEATASIPPVLQERARSLSLADDRRRSADESVVAEKVFADTPVCLSHRELNLTAASAANDIMIERNVAEELGLVLQERPFLMPNLPRVFVSRVDQDASGAASEAPSTSDVVGDALPVGAYLVEVNGVDTTSFSLAEISRVFAETAADAKNWQLRFQYQR
jgi:hypothetical protein